MRNILCTLDSGSSSLYAMQDDLEAKEQLIILMKEADIDQMDQEDITCMMLQNSFLNPALQANLGVVKYPTLNTFNDIIKSHMAGKYAASQSSASANMPQTLTTVE